MPKYWVIAKKIEQLGMEIEADSKENALRIAEKYPDKFNEYGMDEDYPEWTFAIGEQYED